MRIKKANFSIFWIAVAFGLQSCATTASFYQVFNVKPMDSAITTMDELFFENEDCKITYNLWSDGGNIGFNFLNKTDSDIYIKLNESNFIFNGFAYDYFKNRTFTTSQSKSTSANAKSTGSVAITEVNINKAIQSNKVKRSSSANVGFTAGSAVSIREDSIVRIPSKTTKRISEYQISNNLFRDCDLYRYPKRKQIKSMSFEVKNSPIVFSNRITFRINGQKRFVENKFYVSEITNYPQSAFLERKYDTSCGNRNTISSWHYKLNGSDKFFIIYKRKPGDVLKF